MTEMTPKQIENWRRVLFGMFGPYALFMPAGEIIAYRNRVQASVDALPQELTDEKSCKCDTKRHGSTIHKDGRIECNNCHKEREHE